MTVGIGTGSGIRAGSMLGNIGRITVGDVDVTISVRGTAIRVLDSTCMATAAVDQCRISQVRIMTTGCWGTPLNYNGYPVVNCSRGSYDSVNEPYADSLTTCLVLDMHGLIFNLRI